MLEALRLYVRALLLIHVTGETVPQTDNSEREEILFQLSVVYTFSLPNRYFLQQNTYTNCVIPIWNSLSDYVVSEETVNTFKRRLDKFWSDPDVLYDVGSRYGTVIPLCCGYRTVVASAIIIKQISMASETVVL